MDKKQFDVLCAKLDQILGVLSVQNIEGKDKKIYALKKLNFKSEEIERLLGITNVRHSEGWKKK